MHKDKSYEGKTWGGRISVTRHAQGYTVHWWAQGTGTALDWKPFCLGDTEVFRIGTLPDFITQRMAVLDMLEPFEEIEAVGYKGHPSLDMVGVYRVIVTPDETPVLLDFITRSGAEKVEEKAHA